MQWPVRIGVQASGGGPPPPASVDHFAPKYIVGNVPAGDPVAPQGAPFFYIPDAGTGAGIAMALAMAVGAPGDVWIRPGTYVLTAPLVVPPGIRVWGAGVSTIIRSPGAGNMGLFQLGVGSTLGYMRLESIQTGPSVGSPALVQAQSETLLEVLSIAQTLTLSGPMRGALAYSSAAGETRNRARDLDIEITGTGGAAPASWTRGVSFSTNPGGGNPVVFADRVSITGGDVALVIEQGAWVQSQGFFDSQAARAVYLGRDGTARLHNMRAFPSPTALYGVEGQDCTGSCIFDSFFVAPPGGSPAGSAGFFFNNPSSGSTLEALRIVNSDVIGFAPGTSFDDAVRLQGNIIHSVVANNRLRANVRGVALDGTTRNNQVGTNVVQAPVYFDNTGIGNNVQNNVIV